MKNTYKFKFSPLICVLAAIINVLFITVIVLNSLKIGNVGTFTTHNLALDISALVIAIVLDLFVNVIIFDSCYSMRDDYMLYLLGFFALKIRYEDIFIIRQEKTSEALVVNYKKLAKDKDGNDAYYVRGLVINIPNKKKKAFIEDLRNKNSNIVYELIDKELDKKDGISQ